MEPSKLSTATTEDKDNGNEFGKLHESSETSELNENPLKAENESSTETAENVPIQISNDNVNKSNRESKDKENNNEGNSKIDDLTTSKEQSSPKDSSEIIKRSSNSYDIDEKKTSSKTKSSKENQNKFNRPSADIRTTENNHYKPSKSHRDYSENRHSVRQHRVSHRRSSSRRKYSRSRRNRSTSRHRRLPSRHGRSRSRHRRSSSRHRCSPSRRKRSSSRRRHSVHRCRRSVNRRNRTPSVYRQSHNRHRRSVSYKPRRLNSRRRNVSSSYSCHKTYKRYSASYSRRTPTPLKHRLRKRNYENENARGSSKVRSSESGNRHHVSSYYGKSRQLYINTRRSPTPHKGRRHNAAKYVSNRSVSSSSSEKSSKSSCEDEELPEDQLILKLMGVSDFDTSKNKDHFSSDLSYIKKKSKRQYRQYMNRRGGFNRPLSPVF